MFKKIFGAILGEATAAREEAFAGQHSHAEEVDDDAEDEQEEMEEGASDGGDVEYDPLTLHGTHYSVSAFDAEVDQRVEAWRQSEIAEGSNPSEQDTRNARFNLRRDVYQEWTGADYDQIMRWESANAMAAHGMASAGFAAPEAGNALLDPIHGISLEDYAAMTGKISTGVDGSLVCKAMGIEPAVWDEVSALWSKRMQEDGSFRVATLFSQYFATAASHPKLAGLAAAQTAQGAEYLGKLRADRYFYEELCGARQAAYDYGLDGAQWILDNYGVSIGDFQTVASEYAIAQNQNLNAAEIMKYANHQENMKQQYATRFAAEQGGNVADDIRF